MQEGLSSEGALKDVAVRLGMKKPPEIHVEEYYPTFLNMAKNFMEGVCAREGKSVYARAKERVCVVPVCVVLWWYTVLTRDRHVEYIVRMCVYT